MSRQRYIDVAGKWVPINEAAALADEIRAPLIMPDIAPFKSPDGAEISGRAAWREHLRRTDSIEMGHSDIQSAQQTWGKRREAFQNRLKDSAGAVKEASAPGGEIRPFERSNLNVELANRLHGRPTPERKELIKLTLDLAKSARRR